MSTVNWKNKDPADSRADYSLFGWINHVGEAIASATWSVTPSGGNHLTLGASAILNSGDETAVNTDGGVSGTTYTVTCHAVTVTGKEFDRSARLFVTER